MKNIAVVGAGYLGKIHVKLLSSLEGVQAFVVEPNQESRTKISEEFQVSTYADLESVTEELDGAILVTPTETHFEVARKLLDRGCHLLVEKPICATSQEARKLCSFADVKGRVLQVGHVERFNPAFVAAQDLIQQPTYIESTRNTPYSFRATDVSVVLDLMIHDLDLVLSLAQSNVKEVRATGTTVIGPHADVATAWVDFENGCSAKLTASRCSYDGTRGMEVWTEQGQVKIDFATQTVKSMQPVSDIQSIASYATTPGEVQTAKEAMFDRWLPVADVQVEPHNAILEEQKEFIRCIEGNSSPTVSGYDGLSAVKLAEQIADQIEASQKTRANYQIAKVA